MTLPAPPCQTCGCCTCCTGGESTDQVQVVINGWANNGSCTNCANKNATYILDKSAGIVCPGNAAQSDGCGWTYEDAGRPNDCFSGSSYVAGLLVCLQWFASGSDCVWQVLMYLRITNYTSHGNYRVTYTGTTGPCASWSAESFTNFSVPPVCDLTASTCEVTAIP